MSYAKFIDFLFIKIIEFIFLTIKGMNSLCLYVDTVNEFKLF